MRPTLLRLGDRGDAVRDLQERLRLSGLAAEADGEFGPDTEASVRSFQEVRGLRIDGICGPDTWGALVESSFGLGDRLLYHRQPMLRGDDVAAMQQRLNGLGFDAGREDGILGPETENALRRFQRDAGIATDGVCGPATVAALTRLGALAAGSVASVREGERFRRDSRRLDERGLFVVVDPGLAALGDAVARGLREIGAVVALDATGQDPGLLAGEANRFGADVCLSLGSGEPGVRCAYFATQQFRSEAGYAIAVRLTSALGRVVETVDEPVGRAYRILRETRMAAVVVELFSPERHEAAAAISRRSPAIAAAIVDGIRRGVEEPLDVGR